MSAHTPGPWASGLIFNPTSPRPNVIIWDQSKPSAVVVARDVATKDAALIAAAPDLLAALEHFVSRHASSCLADHGKKGACTCGAGPARAAIAAARGVK